MVSQQYIGVGQHCYRWRGAEAVFDCPFVGHNTGILVLNYLFLTQFSLWCLLMTVRFAACYIREGVAGSFMYDFVFSRSARSCCHEHIIFDMSMLAGAQLFS